MAHCIIKEKEIITIRDINITKTLNRNLKMSYVENFFLVLCSRSWMEASKNEKFIWINFLNTICFIFYRKCQTLL